MGRVSGIGPSGDVAEDGEGDAGGVAGGIGELHGGVEFGEVVALDVEGVPGETGHAIRGGGGGGLQAVHQDWFIGGEDGAVDGLDVDGPKVFRRDGEEGTISGVGAEGEFGGVVPGVVVGVGFDGAGVVGVDLGAIVEAVAVGVSDEGVGGGGDFSAIVEAVVVGVLVHRIGAGGELADVGEAVAVGVGSRIGRGGVAEVEGFPVVADAVGVVVGLVRVFDIEDDRVADVVGIDVAPAAFVGVVDAEADGFTDVVFGVPSDFAERVGVGAGRGEDASMERKLGKLT